MTQEQLLKLVSHNLKYGAYVYNQLNTLYDDWDGNYKIEYLYDEIPDNSLLFMVPVYSSKDISKEYEEGKKYTNKLTIRYLAGSREQQGVIVGVYKEKTYTILIENPEGYLTKATSGDIVANRLCIFRFIKGDDNTVILLNSPLYNSISLSTLSVTNEATFYTTPTVVDKTTQARVPLVTETKLVELENRVAKLESKFQFGSDDASSALATASVGTIYIQVEKGD